MQEKIENFLGKTLDNFKNPIDELSFKCVGWNETYFDDYLNKLILNKFKSDSKNPNKSIISICQCDSMVS